MNQQFSIPTALCLPVPDIEALIQGRTIAALPRMFIRSGQRFALYPADSSVTITAWARCELCQILDETKPLDLLSKLTIWTPQALKEIIRQQQHLFLAYLRVYHLQTFCENIVNPNIQAKLGKFVSLSNIIATEDNPVLSNQIFAQRKRQLEKLEPPLHPELEELQSALATLCITNPAAQELDDDIKVFLGWNSNKLNKQTDINLSWINDIAQFGNRSREKDDGKNNYQAGTDFENVVRQSLEYLGFTVDYFHRGGAGGVDVFCSEPYPLVGECKAGKKIPNDTAVQLLNLGTLRLKNQELFKQATKLIIGPGKPTDQLQDAAKVHDMAIINPETLERLVKLQNNYRNSIDLFKLREYLKAGQSDDEVEKYIQQVYQDISLRSHIIQLVKNYLQNSGVESAGVDALHGAYFGSHPPQPLKIQEMHEILIELSSPLTGYLGREKGDNGKSDRFYFLRDLPIN